MRGKRFLTLTAFLVCFGLALMVQGCSKKSSGNNVNNHVESESEIDAFVQSINGIKDAYDNNEITKASLDDAIAQATVLESFFAETPELYQDEEYKTKIAAIHQTINSIDLSKEGLNIEDGAEASFNSLKQIINTLNGKF